MIVPFTEDHETTRETARSFLQAWYDNGRGPERIYQSKEGFDEKAWQVFAKEMGMAGIAIETAYGGSGQGDFGRIVVMEELGASLCAIPFLTSCGIVTDILQIVGEPIAKNRYLRRIAMGELKATYFDGHDAADKVVRQVASASEADLVVLSRRGEGGMDYVAIPTGAAGLVIRREETLDPTRSSATVDWKRVSAADFIPIGYGSEERHYKLVTQSFIALAAESVGGAKKCLEIVTEDFSGRAIDEHHVAEMRNLIETASSAVYGAVIASPDKKTQAVVTAKSIAIDSFLQVIGLALELSEENGGVENNPLQAFYNRAKANSIIFGSSRQLD